MDTPRKNGILDTEIYNDPGKAFREVVDSLNLPDDVRGLLTSYLLQLGVDNPDIPQQNMKKLLDRMLQLGLREEAGLIFNIHRTITEFRGYGANEAARSDVPSCFGAGNDIPKEGVIVVDFFVTRMLPEIVETLKDRGEDLSRIRVCVPKGVLAAQLMNMGEDKRKDFEEACMELTEDQFVIEDVKHSGDISLDEDVAIWFSPRTMPIHPRLLAETEEATIKNYRVEFAERASRIVEGGRIYANLAYPEGKPFQPLGVEVVEGKRRLTKLTGISESVAAEVGRLLVEDLGMTMIGEEKFRPVDRDKKIDHAKVAKEMHLVK